MSSPETTAVPNPGSNEALLQGCTCPVLDNARGRGDGRGNFWFAAGCPLHGQLLPECRNGNT